MTCNVNVLVHELSTAAWTLAAITTLFESGLADALREPRTVDELAGRVAALPRERIARLLEVAAGNGLVERAGDRFTLSPAVAGIGGPMRAGLVADMRSTVMQTAAFIDAGTREAPVRGWYHTNPKLLQAQGDSSAGFGYAFAQHIVHQLGDLATRLAQPSARILDVGSGVGALSIAFARGFPAARIVGLDVFDVPIALARDNVARAELGDRIEIRQGAIEDLREEAAFDVVWLPACFLAPSSIPGAIAHARAALRPGGWLLMPALAQTASDADRRVYSLVLETWGAVTDAVPMLAMLRDAGFEAPVSMPGPGWVALLAAQRT